jgi:hypothetical protein
MPLNPLLTPLLYLSAFFEASRRDYPFVQREAGPEDLREVGNYVVALEHGISRLKKLPLCELDSAADWGTLGCRPAGRKASGRGWSPSQSSYFDPAQSGCPGRRSQGRPQCLYIAHRGFSERLYSRLNWLGLSYPTAKAALAASSSSVSIFCRAVGSRSCF